MKHTPENISKVLDAMRDLAFTLASQYSQENNDVMARVFACKATAIDMAKAVMENEGFFHMIAKLHGLDKEGEE